MHNRFRGAGNGMNCDTWFETKRSERGQDLAEYALLIGLIALIVILAVTLLGNNISGLYVCGSTGEGMSLSTSDRKAIAEASVEAAAGRVPVIVQVGHNSLAEARHLAEHAAEIGADMISATCPSYFKASDVAISAEESGISRVLLTRVPTLRVIRVQCP